MTDTITPALNAIKSGDKPRTSRFHKMAEGSKITRFEYRVVRTIQYALNAAIYGCLAWWIIKQFIP